MIKILIVIPYYYPNVEWGGPVSFVYNLSVALKKKGFKVEILTTDINIYQKRMGVRIKRIKGIKTYFCKSVFSSLAIKYKIFLSFEQILVGLKIIRNFDIVHFHDTFVIQNVLLSILCKFFGIPYIVTPHGSLDLTLTRGKIFLKKIFINFLGRSYFRGAYKIHAVGEMEARKICRFFPYLKDKVVSIPPLFIRERYNRPINIRKWYKISPNDLFLLFLGRIDPMKGVKELTDGFLRYCERYEGRATLVLAGPDGGGMKLVKELVKSSDYKNRIKYVGIVKGGLKMNLIKQCDVLVLLSKSEGFPYSILEAISYGRAILCTRESNAGFIVEAGCGLTTSRRKDEIADKISIFQDRKFLEKCKINSKKIFKSRFDYNRIIVRFINLYRQAYGRSKENYNKLG